MYLSFWTEIRPTVNNYYFLNTVFSDPERWENLDSQISGFRSSKIKHSRHIFASLA